MNFNRFHRLRNNHLIQTMLSETQLRADQLIMPFFVKEGSGREPIPSMPGQYGLSVKALIQKVKQCRDLGIKAVLLFGIPKRKDYLGSSAYDKNGIVQEAVATLKSQIRDVVIMTDVCLCEYTSHGHCGIVKGRGSSFVIRDSQTKTGHGSRVTGHESLVSLDNGATLELLVKTALSHVQAGADIVAPSSMMDGQVAAIRAALDVEGYTGTPILAYSVKFASAFYGPFREAAESAPQFGNRRGYQMDPANAEEALREVAADIEEGADIVMVKPALVYLDILWRVKEKFKMPTAAYCVSGEYAMLEAAIQKKWLSEDAIHETLLSIHRAGADLIITYWAMKVIQDLSF